MKLSMARLPQTVQKRKKKTFDFVRVSAYLLDPGKSFSGSSNLMAPAPVPGSSFVHKVYNDFIMFFF